MPRLRLSESIKENPTSKRDRKHRASHDPQPQPRARPVGAPFSGPELLRRVLLGLITALIVARPLVLGEDPGLLDRSSNATGLVLTLLWFMAAVGWALWRAWSGQASWSWSAVEGGLLGVVGAVMVSAVGAASYKQPAWLIVSEWFVLVIAFVLVRDLARNEGDN